MASVSFEGIIKRFNGNEVIHSTDLDIKDHEFLVLVGPSGCGKSTLLRMLAGLEEISGGRIFIDGKIVNHLSPRDREIAMVFQDYALYPHMTVEENMSFGLRLKRFPKAEIKQRVKDAANILQIVPLLGRTPRQLSGGQRQRVAIGRAIVRKPKVFLFDEPLSNLDAKLREEMRVEIAKLYQKLESTIIYVTHDQVEAMTLAGRIAVMSNGRVQQVGTAIEIYRRPKNLFVAGFIGSPTMNFIDGIFEQEDGKLYFKNKIMKILVPPYAAPAGDASRRRVVLGIRPDDVYTEKTPSRKCSEEISTVLEVSELLGHRENLYLRAGESRILAVVEAFFNRSPGSRIPVWFNLENVHFFDKESGKRITGGR